MSSSPSLDPQIIIKRKASTAPVESYQGSTCDHGFGDKAHKTLLQSESHEPPSSSNNSTWVDDLLFWLDWIIKVLGVAAAVVFGIWAPLTFEASNEASSSAVETQSKLLSAATIAATQASIAVSVQTSAAIQQSVALENLNSRMGAIGQLLLLDFCKENTALQACTLVTSELGGVIFSSLATYLASPTLSVSTTTSATSSSTPNATIGKKSSGKRLSTPAILGIVFGGILVVGVIAGLFVARIKKLRKGAFT